MKKAYQVLIPIEIVLLAVMLCFSRTTEKKREPTSQTYYSANGELVGANGQQKETKEEEELKKVALTFDDGPNECYTEELLDGLAARNVKATFFLIGKKVDENPDIVKRIYEEGHLLGNHSYDHVNLSEMSEEAACEQIDKTNEAIRQITGVIPEYLRPPFGSYKKKSGRGYGYDRGALGCGSERLVGEKYRESGQSGCDEGGG